MNMLRVLFLLFSRNKMRRLLLGTWKKAESEYSIKKNYKTTYCPGIFGITSLPLLSGSSICTIFIKCTYLTTPVFSIIKFSTLASNQFFYLANNQFIKSKERRHHPTMKISACKKHRK